MTTSFAQLKNIPPPRILVIGDLILDRYTWGDAERVSPEAPVLILRVDSREVRLGGAASVAMLLRGLDADVTLAGVIGDDHEGRTLQALLDDEKIKVVGTVPVPPESLYDRTNSRHAEASSNGRTGGLKPTLLVDPSRPTTLKERFVGRAANRHPHQILRVDQEAREPLSAEIEDTLLGAILEHLGDYSPIDAVLISDYAKGVCTPRLLETVIAVANERQIPVIIDPARIADYARYAGATLLKPNRIQAELASGLSISSPEEAFAIADKLRRELRLPAVVITLDREGMVVVEGAADGEAAREGLNSHEFNDGEGGVRHHIPTQPRAVYDITGAGDMVLATLGVCLASGMPLADSASVANVAAGLEIEKLGVTPISREELQTALLLSNPLDREGQATRSALATTLSSETTISSKLTTIPELVELAYGYRTAGKRIVFTNGCFDLLHRGHVACLNEAAALGDVLIVAINSDASVRRLKGLGRPVINEDDRAAMLAALASVDHVLIFDEPTPCHILEVIRPDVLAKGGTTSEIVGREVVEVYGGQVCRLRESPGISTSHIVSRIQVSQ